MTAAKPFPRCPERDPTPRDLRAQLDVLIAERDELKRDRDNLLKVLAEVEKRFEQVPPLMLKIKYALRGAY